MIRLTDQPIDVAGMVDAAEDAGAGGVVLFVGTVRDQTRGRAVARLEYEAYPPMAVSEMEKIAATARERFDVREVDIVHRVGVLRHGEAAVAIVVRAAHRGAAFDACRFAIDTLKETVPIWKKEVYEDGETWVGDRP